MAIHLVFPLWIEWHIRFTTSPVNLCVFNNDGYILVFNCSFSNKVAGDFRRDSKYFSINRKAGPINNSTLLTSHALVIVNWRYSPKLQELQRLALLGYSNVHWWVVTCNWSDLFLYPHISDCFVWKLFYIWVWNIKWQRLFEFLKTALDMDHLCNVLCSKMYAIVHSGFPANWSSL